MKKIIKENRRLLFIIILIFIIASGIILLSYNKRSKELNNKEIDLKNQSEEGLKIEYDLSKIIDENNIKILIKFKSESGINEIIFPNEENIIYGNGKNSIVLDYTAVNGIDYNFKITDVNGNELEKTINVTPYDIYKIEDLENMAKGLDKSYRLMNDLDFKSKDSYRTEEKYHYYNLDSNNDGSPDNIWTPIGNINAEFTGNFDGQKHTINNLCIITSTTDYVGLFGRTLNTNIKNIRLENLILNCKGNRSYNMGGIAGYVEKSTISNIVVNNASIYCKNGNVGGIVGYVDGDVNIIKTRFSGKITSDEDYYVYGAGGIAGRASGISGNYGNLNIEQSCVDNTIITGGDRNGGIIGQITYSNVNISNCYAIGSLKAFRYSGGISYPYDGYAIPVNKIINSYAFMKSAVYPICLNARSVSNVYWNKTKSGATSSSYGTEITDDKLEDQSSYVGFDFSNIWVMKDGIPRLQWEESF